MKLRKIVSMIGTLAVMVSAVLMMTGCPPSEYIKER